MRTLKTCNIGEKPQFPGVFAAIAFLSEVDDRSRKENVSKQEIESRLRTRNSGSLPALSSSRCGTWSSAASPHRGRRPGAELVTSRARIEGVTGIDRLQELVRLFEESDERFLDDRGETARRPAWYGPASRKPCASRSGMPRARQYSTS